MQALARTLREGGSSLIPRLLPALGVTAGSTARITTTAAAPAAQAEAAPSNDALNREFLVYRWDPESGGKPRYDSYKVDINRCVRLCYAFAYQPANVMMSARSDDARASASRPEMAGTQC